MGKLSAYGDYYPKKLDPVIAGRYTFSVSANLSGKTISSSPVKLDLFSNHQVSLNITTGCKTIEDVKHARLTDFQYAGDTKPSSTDPRVRKPYPVTAVNQIKSEPDAATGASHH